MPRLATMTLVGFFTDKCVKVLGFFKIKLTWKFIMIIIDTILIFVLKTYNLLFHAVEKIWKKIPVEIKHFVQKYVYAWNKIIYFIMILD